VCLGSGGKKTICVDGDGGLQLNIQELATIGAPATADQAFRL